MANVGSWQPDRLDTIHYIHKLAEARVGEGYSVISGCDVHEKGIPDMDVVVDSGEIFYGDVYKTVAGNNVTISAANGTNDRIDVIYVDSSGVAQVHTGDALPVSDPLGNTVWTQYESPYPKTGCPAGVIIALVYVPANDTSIENAQIEDIAQYNLSGRVRYATAIIPYDDADNEVTILTMPSNGIVRFVAKICGTAYDAGTVSIGEDGDVANLMSTSLVDATGSTNNTYTPNKYYASGSVIKAFITPHSDEIDLYTTPEIVGNAASGGAYSIASKVFGPIDCSGLTKANGTLSIDVKYVGDALNQCRFEITSSGKADYEEWSTSILSLITQDGDYHTYEFPLATWSTESGEMDPGEIDYIRIYGRSESGDAQFWWKNAKIMMNTSEGDFTLILEYRTV
jgi:hypothetical protein